MNVTYEIKATAELAPATLVAIMAARVAVFVVEQQCAYQEVDEKHEAALHVCLNQGGQLAAYARIVPHDDGEHLSFGRVLVVKSFRHHGLADQLLQTVLATVAARFPGKALKIQAQVYLRDWYAKYGFTAVSEPYLEDGIPHIDMVRPATSKEA